MREDALFDRVRDPTLQEWIVTNADTKFYDGVDARGQLSHSVESVVVCSPMFELSETVNTSVPRPHSSPKCHKERLGWHSGLHCFTRSDTFPFFEIDELLQSSVPAPVFFSTAGLNFRSFQQPVDDLPRKDGEPLRSTTSVLPSTTTCSASGSPPFLNHGRTFARHKQPQTTNRLQPPPSSVSAPAFRAPQRPFPTLVPFRRTCHPWGLPFLRDLRPLLSKINRAAHVRVCGSSIISVLLGVSLPLPSAPCGACNHCLMIPSTSAAS